MNRNISVSINDISGKSWEFQGLKELHDFFSSEAEYWKKIQDDFAKTSNKSHPYINVVGNLAHIANTIESWESNLKDWDEARLNQEVHGLIQAQRNVLQNTWLWSGHPYTSVFVNSNKENNLTTADAFIALVLKKQMPNLQNRDAFLGAVLAYEFLNQDPDLTKRSTGEKASLEHLRDQLDQTTTKLIGEVEDFKEGFSTWDDGARESWNQWRSDAELKHEATQSEFNNEFKQYIVDCEARISELENTYQEKLRLEKPATYWHKSAKKYGWQGIFWSSALIASVVAGIYCFGGFFTTWLQGKQTGIQLNTIEGIILYGSIITIYVFLIKTLSRLAFSSFHLMRDSEEREQLTYLYLSLISGKDIDEKSREIVLQSLFSRSETGLLNSESGPTMPGISEAIKLAATKH